MFPICDVTFKPRLHYAFPKKFVKMGHFEINFLYEGFV